MNYSKAMMVSAFFALLVAGVVSVVGFRAPLAHAADCDITTLDINQIAAIQKDPSLSDSDEIKQELAVRKALVGYTIACAQQEVQTFRTSLASTSVESDSQSLRSQLSGNLDEATSFYNLESAKLNVVGIAGTKAIAQEVFAWRESTFIPLGKDVNNFILWEKNQDLFKTAGIRMTQTQQAVTFLENTTPNPALQTAFEDAQSSFADAENANDAARAALVQNLSPDQSLALIKQSLGSLSDTYQSFSDVSTLIKSNLPK